jgi:Uma2 family endonuclease
MVEVSFESVVPISQGDFAVWCQTRASWDRHHYELLNGRIIMNPPAGYPHGSIEHRVQRLLGTHVHERSLGEVLGSSQGFELPSGDTVEPDTSYVSGERWEAMEPPRSGHFLQVVPELVVEIQSPSTATRDRGEKKAIYERNGVAQYWLIDPLASVVSLYALEGSKLRPRATVGKDEVLESVLLPGLAIPVAELFPA